MQENWIRYIIFDLFYKLEYFLQNALKKEQLAAKITNRSDASIIIELIKYGAS